MIVPQKGAYATGKSPQKILQWGGTASAPSAITYNLMGEVGWHPRLKLYILTFTVTLAHNPTLTLVVTLLHSPIWRRFYHLTTS